MLIKVKVYGPVPRTTLGKVRQSTRRRLVREAREESCLAHAAATEVFYASSDPREPGYNNVSEVTFDTSKPAHLGF